MCGRSCPCCTIAKIKYFMTVRGRILRRTPYLKTQKRHLLM